jgi:hypothetical protein
MIQKSRIFFALQTAPYPHSLRLVLDDDRLVYILFLHHLGLGLKLLLEFGLPLGFLLLLEYPLIFLLFSCFPQLFLKLALMEVVDALRPQIIECEYDD